MANVPILDYVELSMEPDAYNWSMQSTPVVPETSTFPAVFPEPIPINFKIEWGAFFSIVGLNVKFKYVATFEGFLNGYTTNTCRPYLMLHVLQDGDRFGIITNARAGDISITTFDVEYYEDDMYHHTTLFSGKIHLCTMFLVWYKKLLTIIKTRNNGQQKTCLHLR